MERDLRELSMIMRISLGVLLLAGIVTASVVGTRTMKPPPTKTSIPSTSAEGSPIDSLDKCIQGRMHRDDAFGMERLVHPLIQLHKEFDPKTPAERAAVEGLRSSGWTVGLRLGGRSLLGGLPTAEGNDDRAISPSIGVTQGKLSDDQPGPDDLREIARKALQASEENGPGTAAGSIGRWSVEARVIRADRQDCLACHQPRDANAPRDRRLKVGDALGVAIYFSTRDRP
jgi:hypothetical protein